MCTEYKSLKIHRTKFKKCTPCFIHGLTVPFIHTFIDVKRRNNQSSTITARCLPVRSEQLRIVCSLHFFCSKKPRSKTDTLRCPTHALFRDFRYVWRSRMVCHFIRFVGTHTHRQRSYYLRQMR